MTALCCWTGCDRPQIRPDLLLCEEHFSHVGTRFIDERTMGGATYRAMIERSHEDDMRKRREEAIRLGELATRERERIAAASVVYYVRTGRYIKIGYTADLRQRLYSLRLDPTAVLATEPGGRQLEAQRHEQFAEDRIGRREDFAPSLALLEHIRELTEGD